MADALRASWPIRVARQLKWEIRRLQGKEFRAPVTRQVSKEKHGSDYGGWFVCSQLLDAGAIVYSCGIGGDISFDLSLLERSDGLEVHAFDPTPEAGAFIRGLELPRGAHFHPWGVADFDGDANFRSQFDEPESFRYSYNYSLHRQAKAGAAGEELLPVFRIGTIMDRLGHSRLDVLKLDIEGAEYSVIDDVIQSGIRPVQVLVEFHHFLAIGSAQDTKRTIDQLRAAGYLCFHASKRGREYSFCLESEFERSSS